jgi:hypothetical protein
MNNDLISRSALIAYVKELPTWEARDTGFFTKKYPSGFFVPADIVKSIQNAPAVDAVEVVRCKECKHCDPENHHCDHFVGTMIYFPRKPDDFCSYGERK